MTSCVDDWFERPESIGEGKSTVSATVDFRPMASGLTQGTRAAGDAIKAIETLYVLLYDENGNLAEGRQILDFEITNEQRVNADADNNASAETQTPRATFKLREIPYGRYYIYAVANIPDLLTEYSDYIKTKDGLKRIPLAWNNHPAEVEENQKKILAVTGCPTGIAHTYMAAESLEKKAAELGCFIKVETRGSGGAKNVLTAKEIEEADCIIVAADTKVPMDRFAGKPVIICQVSDGISKADKLIQRAMAKDAPIYKGSGEASESESMGGESFGHKVYKHLMNGVSHMLPFVVGGGIMIAIAFLIDSFGVDLASLPTDERANFGTILPAAAFFKSIGGLAFGFMLPVLAGYIAMSIADRPGLVVGFVGGAIAANGKSGFLGALVAGFAAGLIIQLLKKIFDKLPKGLDGLKPVLLYPLLGVLLIGALMTFIIEPPVGALNIAINTGLAHMNGVSSVLLGALVAGMMAVDMGGPLNKAAYVFGTASIAAGNYNIMAAVMIGGMVPPIAIALGTLFFKNKFTAEERKAGPTNFIMGLSFITEGAIPFAAADPLRVIPACVVGSAIAGAMSMAFNCTLMAPHGGIFVFLVMGNAIWYLLSLIVGSAVSCLLLGLLKKKIV